MDPWPELPLTILDPYVLTILLITLFPALAMWAAKRVKVIAWLGPVVLCYLCGIAWANVPGLRGYDGASALMMNATVPLAIPLLLFSTDFMAWMRLARGTIVSFALAVVSVLICAGAGTVVFAGGVERAWAVAGMLVGVYTGGTPNLTAIGLALGVSSETFVRVNIADVFCGAVYFIPLLTVVPIVYRKILPPFDKSESADGQEVADSEPEPLRRGDWPRLLIGFAAAAAVVGIAAGASVLLFGGIQEAMVILTITTLAIAASFVRPLRALPGTYDAGQYLLLMFCVAIGTIAKIGLILAAGGAMIAFVALAMFGSIVLHLALAKLFRVDADTAVITSTAAIYGPPFIGPVANVLKNREIVVSGLTTGVVGLAIGNYAGLALAYGLKWLLSG